MAARSKPRAIEAAIPHVKAITGTLPHKPSQRDSAKGRPLLPRMLLAVRFTRSLTEALAAVEPDLRKLNLASPETLRQALIDSYTLLDKDLVTVNDWLGRLFEVIGPDLPDVRRIENEVIGIFIGLVNSYLSKAQQQSLFTNAYGKPITVNLAFRPGITIRNLRIQRPGQDPIDGPDRGHLALNGARQHLVSTGEFKARGGARDLRPQTTRRTPRFVTAGHPNGTRLVYQLEGSTKDSYVDFAELVFIRGAGAPELLREAEKYSRYGVRAGSVSKAYFATDEVGDPYIRVVTPYATDTLRLVLEKLLRDRSWQR